MIKLALIGCGRHSGRFHGPSLAKYAAEHPDGIELSAACDLDIARAKEFCGHFGFARAYDDVEALLKAEQLDACWAVMPHRAIVPMAKMLLARKMPCVIEKPLGDGPNEARDLAAAADAAGTTHMVSMNRRFNPCLTRATEWARSQGPILYAYCRMVRHNRREPGLIRGVALHGIDALIHTCGEVADFSTQIVPTPAVSGQWYMIDFRFAGGALGRLDLLSTAGQKLETYDLYGEGFRCRVSVPIWGSETSVRCWKGNQLVVEEVAGPDEPEFILDGAYAETVHFLDSLREGRQPHPSVREALSATEITFAIADQFGPPGVWG